jgi:predicted MPP superfamily phosphohydrolase
MSQRVAWFALFGISVLVVVLGVHLYFFSRLVGNTALGGAGRKIAFWSLVVLPVLTVAVMPLGRVLPQSWSPYVVFIPYLWMGAMFYLTILLLTGDLVRTFLWLAYKISGWPVWWGLEAKKILFHRALAAGSLALVGLICIAGVFQAFRTPQVVALDIPLPGLPAAFRGFRLVQITDLHLGPTLGRRFLEKVVELANSREPDAVVITGDLADGSPEKLAGVIAPLKDLRARYGVFFSTGNHEYYLGWEKWREALENLGLVLLENRCVELEKEGQAINVAGVNDPDGRRFGHPPDIDQALSGCEPGAPVILLSHQARLIDRAAEKQVSLVLSGHNHGGQIWPWSYLVLLQQPFVSGLHRVGKTWLYISQGSGFWGPPLRLGTRSEITLLILKDEKNN